MTNADTGLVPPVPRPPRLLLIAALLMSLYQWLVLVTTIPYPGRRPWFGARLSPV